MKDLNKEAMALSLAEDGEHVTLDGREFIVSYHDVKGKQVYLTDVNEKPVHDQLYQYPNMHVRKRRGDGDGNQIGDAVLDRLEMIRLIGLNKYIIE